MAQEKLAESIFDSVVKRYDRFLKTVTFGLIDKWQEVLVKNTPAGKIPLDVGTGTGEVVKKIMQEYPECLPVGVDVSFNMLRKAKEKNRDSFFLKASAYNLPFKDGSISSIYMSLVFRHLRPEESIEEFSRILSNRGCIGILDISKPSKILFNGVFSLQIEFSGLWEKGFFKAGVRLLYGVCCKL
ncbi:MAG: class I SAM-dependent methyltransferase [Persephonella sp.]|nr:class I SAM-dependent methyltransferase [Persephonella sp.]